MGKWLYWQSNRCVGGAELVTNKSGNIHVFTAMNPDQSISYVLNITSLMSEDNWYSCGREAIIGQTWAYSRVGFRVSDWKRVEITSSFGAAHGDLHLQHTLLYCCQCTAAGHLISSGRRYLSSVLVHAVVSVTQMNVVDFQRWRSQPFHCYRTGFQPLQRQLVVVCVGKLL